jgi:hypothetical protein
VGGEETFLLYGEDYQGYGCLKSSTGERADFLPSGYRLAGQKKIKLPFRLRILQGDTTILAKLTNVKNNIPMEDALFRPVVSK